MALVFDKEWDSLTEYDDDLMKIKHFQLHPEMLPYVGRHYQKIKVLLLGESHYISNDESDDVKQLKDWYNRPSTDYSFIYPTNFFTRGVIRNYLIGSRSRAYIMFTRPANVLIDSWSLNNVNESEAFTAFAFFNYFQRPASNSGGSIELTDEDEMQAYVVYQRVVESLKPDRIIFLSKKAYNSYKKNADYVGCELIDYVYHPTCSYWGKEEGTVKLQRLFSEMTVFDGFIPNGYVSLDKAEKIMSTTSFHQLVGCHKKRFYANEITYKLYLENPSSVGEIVWFLMTEGRRYGIGYMVKIRFLWIWDYDYNDGRGRHLRPLDLDELPEITALYEKVIELVMQL